ncbi:peptidylprolyl isomerase [Glaciimonas sp. CA11.2]|uniref:peptidylprolyl isomerase n=1 Tax=unclassified Glaciimonas TaxID=2644401 RepID=UPI002AB37E55|nr:MULTISPECIES: peptidylprolyl isomerase [unclassified Glaciimonas]MDY7547687.1 peptidylprolyl isomerase [Glaciimonas sp. CA11.2]MEB0012993.1 peptidylprolyl isomerase [Glaciimonas sp. Cout2]MEB0082949.1 peptidylprolyl isomerase [Glaciimonas sp. Gout2]MEB0161396.1 peptidylprolyl isomerase [Glaciimonas sp. CA11.2]
MQRIKQSKVLSAPSTSRRTFSRVLATSIAALSLSFAFSNAHAADMPHVLLKTNMGDIVLELNAEKAPKTVKNFLSYVNTGHYNGTVFHRVIDGFMIQGGGFDKKMNEKPAPNKVENEGKNGLKNTEYSVAMARTSDPQSASAQFFINVKDNQFLNYPGQDGYGYAVFGKVIQGMEVVDKIKKVKTGAQDVPVQQVIIESASITK